MHTLSIAAASISAKILMTFNDVKRETEYNSNMATLKDVLGENVRLVMADSDGNGVTGVKYQLYLNEKCALDGDEVKVGRERSVNINANENKEILIGNMDIPAEEFGCGPICLFAIADGDSKARARISKACDKGQIDLELVFDDSKLPNKRQSVDFDEDLSSKLNVLKNLKVKNKAGKDSPKRSKELKQSLTVAIRTNSITEEGK
ncbi:hypothetical protein EB796_022362 [Bugula neritina]|uniref:Uncharacterized protein n=1 Tax=Bugula neritina TaxID=10212 RepID=A0A7J7J105_BUGNE|nr:hypothetical protein EB796_022362 [Bugula neritina]